MAEPLETPYQARPSRLDNPVPNADMAMENASRVDQTQGQSLNFTGGMEITPGQDPVILPEQGIPGDGQDRFPSSDTIIPTESSASGEPNPFAAFDSQFEEVQKKFNQELPELGGGYRAAMSFGTGVEQKAQILRDLIGPENIKLGANGEEILYRMPGQPDNAFRPVNAPTITLNDALDMIGGALEFATQVATEGATTIGGAAVGGPIGATAGAFAGVPIAGVTSELVKRFVYKMNTGKELPGNAAQEALNSAMYNSLFGAGTAVGVPLTKKIAGMITEWNAGKAKNVAGASIQLQNEFTDLIRGMNIRIRKTPEAAIPELADVSKTMMGSSAFEKPTPRKGPDAPVVAQLRQKLGEEIDVYTNEVQSAMGNKLIPPDPMLDSMLNIAGKQQYFGSGPYGWQPKVVGPSGQVMYNKLPLSASAIKDMSSRPSLGQFDPGGSEYKYFAKMYNALIDLRQNPQNLLNDIGGPSSALGDAFSELPAAQRMALMEDLPTDAQAAVASGMNGGMTAKGMQSWLAAISDAAEFQGTDRARKGAQKMFGEIRHAWADYRNNAFENALAGKDPALAGSFKQALKQYENDIVPIKKLTELYRNASSSETWAYNLVKEGNEDVLKQMKNIFPEELWSDFKTSWFVRALDDATTESGIVSGAQFARKIQSLGPAQRVLFDSDVERKQFISLANKAELIAKRADKLSPGVRSGIDDFLKVTLASTIGSGPFVLAATSSKIKTLSDIMGSSKTVVEYMADEGLVKAAKEADSSAKKRAIMVGKRTLDILFAGAKEVSVRGGKIERLVPLPNSRIAAAQFLLSTSAGDLPGKALAGKIQDMPPGLRKSLEDMGFKNEEVEKALEGYQKQAGFSISNGLVPTDTIQ